MAVINTNPNFKRLRRSMMFLNAQKPSLIKDPYVYKPDSIMLDLEDAVAENQKGCRPLFPVPCPEGNRLSWHANALSVSTAWKLRTGRKISASA